MRVNCPAPGQEILSERKTHSFEQIVQTRDAETELTAGKPVEGACKRLEVSQQTYVRRKKEYGGAKPDEVRRLKALKRANQRFKAIVRDLQLDKQILKESMKNNY